MAPGAYAFTVIPYSPTSAAARGHPLTVKCQAHKTRTPRTKTLGHPSDRPFSRRIWGEVRHSLLARNGRGSNNPSSSPLLDHLSRSVLVAQESAPGVHGKHFVPIFDAFCGAEKGIYSHPESTWERTQRTIYQLPRPSDPGICHHLCKQNQQKQICLIQESGTDHIDTSESLLRKFNNLLHILLF
jgi:hypothetical protein